MGNTRDDGRILTFYSYKGGAGRSLAVANLAWVLAANRKRVLLIDWDLEAPGLHRYFQPFLKETEADLRKCRGLIDLLADYSDLAVQPQPEEDTDDWFLPLTEVRPYVLGINFDGFPEGGRIDLMPAGRQGPNYATKLHAFDWNVFYERLGGGAFLEAFKARLRQTYDYILIDSRTGVSDTAGICTVQMPDVLVTLFTYNNQSILGALAVAQSAIDARQRGYGQYSRGTFRVFPVPSRADTSEVRKLQLRQAYAHRMFEPLLTHLSNELERSRYWAGVEVPYNAFLNYEEVLAPLVFNPEDSKLPLASVLRLASYVTDGDVDRYELRLPPDRLLALLEDFEKVGDEGGLSPVKTGREVAGTLVSQSAVRLESSIDGLVRKADAVLAKLDQAKLEDARHLLMRLVRLPQEQETPGLKRLVLPLGDVPDVEQPILELLVQAEVLCISQAQERGELPAVEIVNDSLTGHWRQLIEWANAGKEFLALRDWMRSAREQWNRGDRSETLLLAAPLVGKAAFLLDTQSWLLTPSDVDFIETSRAFQQRNAEAANLLASKAGFESYQHRRNRSILRLFIVSMLFSLALIVASSAFFFLLGSRVFPIRQDISGKAGAPAGAQASSPADIFDATGVLNSDGEKLLQANLVDQAIEQFDRALELRPEYAEALFNRARAFELKNQTDKAIADVLAGLKTRPKQGDARMLLARLLARNSNTNDAISQYRYALTLELGPEQRQEAEQALEKLSPGPIHPTATIYFDNQNDLGEARNFTLAVESSGVHVKNIQVNRKFTMATVAYVFGSDMNLARKIQDTVRMELKARGFQQTVQVEQIGDPDKVIPPGQFDVWIPRLTQSGRSDSSPASHQVPQK